MLTSVISGRARGIQPLRSENPDGVDAASARPKLYRSPWPSPRLSVLSTVSPIKRCAILLDLTDPGRVAANVAMASGAGHWQVHPKPTMLAPPDPAEATAQDPPPDKDRASGSCQGSPCREPRLTRISSAKGFFCQGPRADVVGADPVRGRSPGTASAPALRLHVAGDRSLAIR